MIPSDKMQQSALINYFFTPVNCLLVYRYPEIDDTIKNIMLNISQYRGLPVL